MEKKVSLIEDELEGLLVDVFGKDERTKMVMERHIGFNAGVREKLEDIAKDIEITKEAVRQRSIKGVRMILDSIEQAENDEDILPFLRYGMNYLKLVVPCSEADAAKLFYNEGITNRKDLNIDALINVLQCLEIDPGIVVREEGKTRFVVDANNADVIKSLVKKAREQVSHFGAYHVSHLAQMHPVGHERLENSLRCVVAALEAQPDFVWLEEEYTNPVEKLHRTGFFLLKDAGRNPIELRLRRVFAVRKSCPVDWVTAKITQSFRSMKRENILSSELIAAIGIAKGICEHGKIPGQLVRAKGFDGKPEDLLPEMEYKIWDYLVKNPLSRDGAILKDCKESDKSRHNIRSKLNFSMVIERVRHGVYNAVTDKYPDFKDRA